MKDNQSAKDFCSSNTVSSNNCLKQKDSNHLSSEIYSEKNKAAYSSSMLKNLLLFNI